MSVTNRRRGKARLIATTALAATAFLVLSACSGPTQPSGGGDEEESILIGVTLPDAGNAFFHAEVKGVEAAAEEHGVTLSVQYANSDLPTQTAQIQAFVAQGAKAILLDTVDQHGIAPAVAQAQAAGVYVVAFGSYVKGADATVHTDNVAAGENVCAYMIEHLGGEGTFAIADSKPVSSIADRISGCKKALEAAPGITVVAEQRAPDSRAGGLSIGADFLQAHPDLDAIFAINDPQAAGISLAAAEKGSSVIIGGVDGSIQAVSEIRDGGRIVATAAQFPVRMAVRALELALDLLGGAKLSDTPELILPELINSENADSYTAWDEE